MDSNTKGSAFLGLTAMVLHKYVDMVLVSERVPFDYEYGHGNVAWGTSHCFRPWYLWYLCFMWYLLTTNWNNLKFPFETAYRFADTEWQFVHLMKPLSSSQFEKEFWSLHRSSASQIFYGGVMPVQVQWGFLVKIPESHWCLEDSDLRRNWGDLQTEYQQRRCIWYLQTGKFSVPFVRWVAGSFLFQWNAQSFPCLFLLFSGIISICLYFQEILWNMG